MQVAVDGFVLVGLPNPRDVWHAQAETVLQALLSAGIALVYFDCVAVEAVRAAVRRLR